MFVANESARRDDASQKSWAALAQGLEQQLGKAHYEAWFSRLLCRSFSGEHIQLVSQNEFTKDWIQRRFLNDVQSAALKIDGQRRVVQVLHEGEVPRAERLHMSPLGGFVPAVALPANTGTLPVAGETASGEAVPGTWVGRGSQRARGTGTGRESVWGGSGSGEARAPRSVPGTLRGIQRRAEGLWASSSTRQEDREGAEARRGVAPETASGRPKKPDVPAGEGTASQPFWMREVDEPEERVSSAEGPSGGAQASTPTERERMSGPSGPIRPGSAGHSLFAPSFQEEGDASPSLRSAGPVAELPAGGAAELQAASVAEVRRVSGDRSTRPSRDAFSGGGGGGGGDEPPFFFSDFILNDAFKFDSFVVGDCNELAHASAKALTEFPGRGYNPFFIYGGSGLGKTHLQQAICHEVRRRHDRKRIVYLSCESFVNQFIQAITDGELDRFRHRCRMVDLLVIDDIQFLEGKTRTQEEFFHTFNSLFHADKQIILSCDRPPKEIPTLQDRLISRFRWGMVAQVERPRYETRVAIVQRKAEMRGILLPPEVAECIAEHIDSNIRELEGAVTKVLNFAELMHREIDLTAVRDALRDLVPDTPRVSVQDILECVGKEFRLSPREIQSRKRAKSIVRARQVAMYLSRQLTSLSFEEIGGFFGGRDHTTVMHGFRRMVQAIAEDGDFGQKVERLRMRLQRGG